MWFLLLLCSSSFSHHALCVLRFSQDAAALLWLVSAVTSPSCPAGAWPNAGWSPAGGWAGFWSTTGTTSLAPRFRFLSSSQRTWSGPEWWRFHVRVSSADSSGSGETQPAYSGSLHHRPGGAREHPEQHPPELLQQHHQLPEGEEMRTVSGSWLHGEVYLNKPSSSEKCLQSSKLYGKMW